MIFRQEQKLPPQLINFLINSMTKEPSRRVLPEVSVCGGLDCRVGYPRLGFTTCSTRCLGWSQKRIIVAKAVFKRKAHLYFPHMTGKTAAFDDVKTEVFKHEVFAGVPEPSGLDMERQWEMMVADYCTRFAEWTQYYDPETSGAPDGAAIKRHVDFMLDGFSWNFAMTKAIISRAEYKYDIIMGRMAIDRSFNSVYSRQYFRT